MKKFVNLVTKVPLGEAERPHCLYSDLATACLNNRPQQGFTPEELFTRLAVLKRLDARGPLEVIELEDAEAAKLLVCVNEMTWGMLSTDIGEFVTAMRTELVKTIK